MTKIVLDMQTLQTIALFEQMSGAAVKDCIPSEGQLVFIVNEGEIAKAIGKGGTHVRSLEYKTKKRVKIVEFSTDIIQFVKNLVAPVELLEAKLENTTLFLQAKDLKSRGLLIGRSASNLRAFESIIKRYFPIEEMRVA